MDNGFLEIVIPLAILTIGLCILSGKKTPECEKSFIFPVTFFSNHLKITGGITMVSIKYTQQLRGALGSPVDAKGNEAPIEAGTLKITSDDPEIFTVEPDENQPDNEFAFKIVAKKAGVAQLNYEADADLGDGVKTISGFTGVEVLPGEAVGFGTPVFGEVEEQPAVVEEPETPETPEAPEGGEQA